MSELVRLCLEHESTSSHRSGMEGMVVEMMVIVIVVVVADCVRSWI
jgi:hypothetical protein